MSCSFPKSARVRTRRQYQRISQHGQRHVGEWVVVDVCRSKGNSTKLGITASRHYGMAVQRNRFKRIVREAFRLCRAQLLVGFDINVKPRQMAHKAKTADVLAEILCFLKQPVESEVAVLP